MSTPNEADFQKNERLTEYQARFLVKGEILLTIHAASLEEARQKAEAELVADDFGLELDDVADVRLDHVMKTPAMFLVTRDNRKMQVSRLMEGDLPREFDANGF